MKRLTIALVGGLLVGHATRDEAMAQPPPSEPASDVAVAESSSLAELEARQQRTEDLVLNHQPIVVWGGYIDLGFFVPQGNGSGFVQDFGHLRYPQYAGQFGWVFLGDILAPTVNSRGEAADLGDAPGVDRFDSIHSRGAPGFVANEVNVNLRATVAAAAVATASVNFAPRTGTDFRLGDVFDVDIAQVEWMPTASQRTSIFVGKMESVIGIEYRDRKSNRRFGVTPSLLARYTTGTALGVKARSKFGSNDWLVVALAATNGSNTIEQFHFYNEIDTNAAKTLSSRLAVRLPLPFSVEVGGSASWGAQDRSPSSRGAMWFIGPDLLASWRGLDLKMQLLRGQSPGDALNGVYALRLHKGGYAEADVMLTPSWGVMGRLEFRDALVWLGNERLYVTKSWRATAGVRLVVNEHVSAKAEYLHNGEYGGLPQVRNDVFTSSLVLAY